MVRSLASKLQAMQKQEATESLSNARRLSGVTAAIETLAAEVDTGRESLVEQLSLARMSLDELLERSRVALAGGIGGPYHQICIYINRCVYYI